ncbi:MAG: hypothetical protein ACK4UZ_11990 [Rhizobium rhizophilum]
MSDAAIATTPTPQTRPQSGAFWPMLWRQFRAHPGGVAGLIVFVFIVAAVFIGPYIHTIDPNKIDIRAKNQGRSHSCVPEIQKERTRQARKSNPSMWL